MTKIKSMELDVKFNSMEQEFYDEHKEILHNMLEKVAIVSSKHTTLKYIKRLPRGVKKMILDKYDEELNKLK